MARPRRASIRAKLPVLLWAGLLAAGWAYSIDYASRPGAAGRLVAHWPADAQVSRSESRPTLLVFAHPLCPCTRATISQLEELVARCGEGLDVHVLLRSDPELGLELERGELWRKCTAIAGIDVRADVLGTQARLFGAETSGHALLFSPEGRLLFSGGLTRARGHAGSSSGFEAIAALALGSSPKAFAAPVFGCALAEQR